MLELLKRGNSGKGLIKFESSVGTGFGIERAHTLVPGETDPGSDFALLLSIRVTIQVSEKPVQLNIIKKNSRRGAIVFKSSHDMLPSIGNPLLSLKQLSEGMILAIYIFFA